jgi:hypothetical protein
VNGAQQSILTIDAYLSDPSTRVGFFGMENPSIGEPPSLAGVTVMRESSIARKAPQVGEVRFTLAISTDSLSRALSAIDAYLSDPSTRVGFLGLH